MFDAVVVLPVYNHGAGALRVLARIREQGLPCIVVDDGSDAADAALLDSVVPASGVTAST